MNQILDDFWKAMAPHRGKFAGMIFVAGDWEGIFEVYAHEEGLAEMATEEMDALIAEVTPVVESSWEWRKGIQEQLAELGNEMLSTLIQSIIVDLKSKRRP